MSKCETLHATARPRANRCTREHRDEGLFNDLEATAQAFVDGWFHSGDAAVVHSDGYVEIRDRLKDMTISGGENISSVEVEGALLQHPAVLEVAVIGVPHPKWGESPKAFVVLRAGSSASAAELHEFARSVLAHFKAPSAYEFVAALPKTATIGRYVAFGYQRGVAADPASTRPCLVSNSILGRGFM